MPSRPPLSPKQEAVYEAIRRTILRLGRPLQLEEIAQACRPPLYDRSAAGKYVDVLAEKGYVRRRPGHQGIELSEGSGLILPLTGLAAAGTPLANLCPDHGFFNFNAEFGGEDNFMLQVRGDSMIDAHIASGDFIVVQPTQKAEDGQKVVMRIDGELTLKILRNIRGHFWLYACNPAIKPLRLDPRADNDIVGVLIGVVRKEK